MKPMGNSGNAPGIHPALIITCAILLRLYAASLGHVIHADEQFQVLEPAFRAVYGFGWKSWEWQSGFRPWTVPGVFIPLLWLLKTLGVGPGMVLVAACRAFMALAWALPLWGFYRLCRLRELSEGATVLALGLLAFLPNMVAWGAATFSESVATIILWTALPYIVKPGSKPGVVGLLAAAPVAARYQMAAWTAPLAATLVARRPRSIPFMLIGCIIPVLAVAALDLVTWGNFGRSLYWQVRLNAMEGASAMNGVSPWYAFGGMMLKNFGAPALGVLFLPLCGALAVRKLRWTALDGKVLLPTAFFCLAHMTIGHKELRFLLPAFPALFYLCALGLDALLPRWPLKLTWARSLPTALVLCAFSSAHVQKFEHFEPGALGALTGDAQRWFDKHPEAPPRVAIVANYWIWTRGEMGLGRSVQYEDIAWDKVSAEKLQQYPLAFVSGYALKAFKLRAQPWGWRLEAMDAFNNGLFTRTGAGP